MLSQATATTQTGYRCTVRRQSHTLNFEAFTASEAYAAALLHILTASVAL